MRELKQELEKAGADSSKKQVDLVEHCLHLRLVGQPAPRDEHSSISDEADEQTKRENTQDNALKKNERERAANSRKRRVGASSFATESFERARGEEEPVFAGDNGDSYLESAFELNGDDFGKYFQDKHKVFYHKYEELCRTNCTLDDIMATPLVFVETNQHFCCVLLAKQFIDTHSTKS